VEMLHHHVRSPGVEFADIRDADDVLAPQSRRRARLAKKSSDERMVGERFVGHELQRDRHIEPDVARRDHDAHAARAQHALDAVLPREDLSRARRPLIGYAAALARRARALGRVGQGPQVRVVVSTGRLRVRRLGLPLLRHRRQLWTMQAKPRNRGRLR